MDQRITDADAVLMILQSAGLVPLHHRKRPRPGSTFRALGTAPFHRSANQRCDVRPRTVARPFQALNFAPELGERYFISALVLLHLGCAGGSTVILDISISNQTIPSAPRDCETRHGAPLLHARRMGFGASRAVVEHEPSEQREN